MTEVKLKIESGKNSAVGIKNNQHETPYYKLHVAKKKKKKKERKKFSLTQMKDLRKFP